MTRTHRRRLGLTGSALLIACAGCGDSGGSTGGSITITASGEALALGGYDFPFTDAGFVDGWEVRFTELLVTVDKVTLSENPDSDPGDQSKTGALVAEVDGPFAIDLHKGGPLLGKGGSDEQAVQIATITSQNKNGNKAFDPTVRYAFGFDVVAATDKAKLINLDEQGKADYAMMQDKGYTVLYVGTATFKGTACSPASPELDKLPKVVNFKLGFRSPTTYINCQNPDNDPAEAFAQEEHQRGIFVKENQAVTAQVTIHTDHPFWESFVHDSPAHFDPIAARYVGASGTPTTALEDMIGVDITAFKDNDGNALPWRTCIASYTPTGVGPMSFDTAGVKVDPKGDPATSIRDDYDFTTYAQSTQGHLNSDGLCFVKRNYPSPP